MTPCCYSCRTPRGGTHIAQHYVPPWEAIRSAPGFPSLAKRPQWTCSCGTKAKSLFMLGLILGRRLLPRPAKHPNVCSMVHTPILPPGSTQQLPPFIGILQRPASLLQYASDPLGRLTGSTKSNEPAARWYVVLSVLMPRSGRAIHSNSLKHLMT